MRDRALKRLAEWSLSAPQSRVTYMTCRLMGTAICCTVGLQWWSDEWGWLATTGEGETYSQAIHAALDAADVKEEEG